MAPKTMTAPLRTWIVLAKAPHVGRVKSRLATSIGAEAACELQEAMLRDLLALHPPNVRRVLALAGAHANLEAAARALGWEVQDQPAGDLGERMATLLAWATGSGPAILTGSDAPLISAAEIEAALHHARRHRLVLGPALDGGFVLIGGSREAVAGGWSALLHGHVWSHAGALAQVIARAARLGVGLHLRAACLDIDTMEDLARLDAALQTRTSSEAPKTAAWLDETRPLWQELPGFKSRFGGRHEA